ncbi:MAG: peptide chain release factor 1 [Candidatus Babeliales bacterium]
MANQTVWDTIKLRRDELMQALMNPVIDNAQRSSYQKELSHLTALFDKYTQVQAFDREIKEVQEQAFGNKDSEMADLYTQELVDLNERHKQASNELEELMFPPNEIDDRNIYLEIRAGAGGQEAALFAGDLLKMYTNYALKRHWKVSVESSSSTDLGGLREVILHIKGKGVYGQLKFESGVHRVQRVPQTETQGRIHTSTATVAVLPEAEEVDVTINPADLRIDVYRSSGAGGQHVNTTDSAVRVTHIPTGVAVACQEERSQHKNKEKAMKMLKARILAAQVEKQQAELSQQRKEMVGTGMRAEKVRTYNFPQNRITDHQVDLTLQKLDMVMQGDLDDIIQALRKKEYEERRKQPVLISS